MQCVRKKKIPHFRGVFMRNTLPKSGPNINESGIINLDMYEGEGTHWISYVKKGDHCLYFDSYGDLRPPKEFIRYINGNGVTHIEYNYNRVQKFNTQNCGHLCLNFLYDTVKNMF